MKLAIACALALAISSPARSAEWRTVGDDAQIDMQSIKAMPDGFVVVLKHTNLQRNGMPPPAASAEVHTRISCLKQTFQSLDVAYFDLAGRVIQGGGPYKTAEVFPINPGAIPDRIQKQICPSLHREGSEGPP